MTIVLYDSGLQTILGNRYGSVWIIYGPAKKYWNLKFLASSVDIISVDMSSYHCLPGCAVSAGGFSAVWLQSVWQLCLVFIFLRHPALFSPPSFISTGSKCNIDSVLHFCDSVCKWMGCRYGVGAMLVSSRAHYYCMRLICEIARTVCCCHL